MFEGVFDSRVVSAVHILLSPVYRGVKGRETLIKLKDSECGTCERERKAIMNSPSLQTCLSALFPLFCLFSLSLSLRHVYISHRRKQTETIKPSLLGNGSCVLHRRLTLPSQGFYGNTPLRGSAFASLGGMSH